MSEGVDMTVLNNMTEEQLQQHVRELKPEVSSTPYLNVFSSLSATADRDS